MATVIDKDSMVPLLRDEYRALADLCAPLGDEEWSTPTCLPGWTVHDVVSHVVGAEAGLLGEPLPMVDVPPRPHVHNPIAEANEQWVESMRPLAGPELLSRLVDVTARRLAVLEAMTQEDFDAPSWTPAGPDETYGRFMRIRHYDCYLHEQDVRYALGLPDRDAPLALGSALDEVATGLGYIVGRRARMSDGTSVRIDLTGPVPRTYLVRVDGRAAVVDRLDGEPTVGLQLPAARFLRLTGGRNDPGVERKHEVRCTGDQGLADQLLANLSFTI